MRPREGGLQWGEKFRLRVTTACGALRAVFASLRALFSFLPIRSCVIHGSCLGPLLFLMFINDITDILNDSVVCKLYANNVAPATVLNGKSGDNAIQHEFTCYYSNIFKPNTANADERFRAKVEKRLSNEYHNTSQTPVPSIDISSLLDHIGKLKKGKSAGLDGIVNEHILYGGECLTVHICLLFNSMTIDIHLYRLNSAMALSFHC